MVKAPRRARVLALLVLSLLASLPLGSLQRPIARKLGSRGPRAPGHHRTDRAVGPVDLCGPYALNGRGAAARQRAVFSPARVPVDVWLDTPERLAAAVANPGTWHGQVVGLVGTFHTSLAAEAALFVVGQAQWMVMRPVPAGRFTHPGERGLFAGHLPGDYCGALPSQRADRSAGAVRARGQGHPLWYRQTVVLMPTETPLRRPCTISIGMTGAR